MISSREKPPVRIVTASVKDYTVTNKTVDGLIDKFIFTYFPNAPKAAVERLKAELKNLNN